MPRARSPRTRAIFALALATVAAWSVPTGNALAHDGHDHGAATLGPPPPAGLWEGADEVRDAYHSATFAAELDAAPVEVAGSCTTTVEFDGIGDGCRTKDGMLRIDSAAGPDSVTHGPDYLESVTDLDPATTAPHVAAAVQRASSDAIHCTPESEPHTLLVYAIAADSVDRGAQLEAPLRQAAYEAAAVIDNTARSLSSTAGRKLRMACDAGEARVERLRLPHRLAETTFDTVKSDIARALGHAWSSRTRYLVYFDGHLGAWGGLGDLSADVVTGTANRNNQAGRLALQDDSEARGPSWETLLHELTHNMGATQDAAPDSNTYGHCNDGLDVMCYAEGGQPYSAAVCPELQYDCGADTYFNPAPAGGSWLASNWNIASTSNRSLEATTETADTTPPGTPTGLSATGHGDFIRLSWTGVADADLHTYRIELDDGGWRTVADSWMGATSVDVTWDGFAPSTNYQLRVRAYDQRGNLGTAASFGTVDSGIADAEERIVDGPELDPPTNVVVESRGAGSLVLRWHRSHDHADWYEVEMEYPGGWWYRGATSSDTRTLTTDVYGDPIDPAEEYRVRVRAARLDTGRTSAWVELTSPATGSAPATPTNLNVAASSGTTPTLEWDAMPGATDYVVAVETSPGTWTTNTIVTGTSAQVSGLTFGATHQLGVVARGASGAASSRATTTFAPGAQGDVTPPTEPSVENYFDVTTTTITNFEWTGSTDDVGIAGYRIVAVPTAQPWAYHVAATVGPGVTMATATGLTPGTAYAVHVEAFDLAGHATRSSNYYPVTTDADSTDPTTPTSLTANATSATTIDLDWNPSTDASGVASYRVWRTLPGPATLVATVSHPTTDHELTGLDAATDYEFQVEAVDVAGNVSARSNTAPATTPSSDVTPPSQPGAATVLDTSGSSITIGWGASSDDVAVVGYEIRANDALGAPLATTPLTSHEVTSLDDATGYTFAIVAYDAAGNESVARTVSGSTDDATAPTTPTGLAASLVTASSFTVSWNASTDNVATTGYRVYLDDVEVATPAGTSHPFAGLDDFTDHEVEVQARDAAGNWSPRAQLVVRTLDATAPTAPGTPVQEAIRDDEVDLSWPAATDNDQVAGYRVYVLPSAIPALVTGDLTATIGSLAPDTDYTIQVAAYDPTGLESARSSIDVHTAAAPDLQAPDAPAGMASSLVTTSSFTVTWSASADNVATTKYRVWLDDALVATIAGTSRAFSGLAASTDHDVEVAAGDAAGNWSARTSLIVRTDDIPDVTDPTTPTNLRTTDVTGSRIDLEWDASSDDVGVVGYEAKVVGGAVTATATLTASLTGLDDATTYDVEVVALDAAGKRSNPATIEVTTDDATAPTPPSGFSTTNVTTTGGRLTWAASSDNVGVVGYDVQRWTGSTWVAVGVRSAATFRDITGLAAGAVQMLQVRAIDAAGNASTFAVTAIVTGTPPTPPPTTTAPAGVSSFTATASTTRIQLAWQGSGQATSYRVTISRAGAADVVHELTSTSLALGPLPPRTTVTAQVVELANGLSSGAASLTASTLADVARPTRVIGARATSLPRGRLLVRWRASRDDVSVLQYELRLTTRRVRAKVVRVAGSRIATTVAGLRRGAPYAIQLRAIDASGNASAWTTIRARTR